DAHAGDDAVPGNHSEVSPLIVMSVAPTAGVDLLQAGNVSVDLPQHSGDSSGVVASVNADTSMYVVGRNPDRRHLGNNGGYGSAPGAIDGPFRSPSYGHLEIFEHSNLRGLPPS